MSGSRIPADLSYRSYTLVKLMIIKLRYHYRREQGAAYPLRRSRDTFISFGAPPIPLDRHTILRKRH